MTSLTCNSYSVLDLHKKYKNRYKLLRRINNLLFCIEERIKKLKKKIIKNLNLINIENNTTNVLTELYNIFGNVLLEKCEIRLKNELPNNRFGKNYTFTNFLNKNIKFVKLNNAILTRKINIYCKRNNIISQYNFNEIFNQNEVLFHIGFKNKLDKFTFYIDEKSKIIINEIQIYTIKFYLESLLIANKSFSIYDYIFLLELNDIVNFLKKNIKKNINKLYFSMEEINHNAVNIQKFYRKYIKNRLKKLK